MCKFRSVFDLVGSNHRRYHHAQIILDLVGSNHRRIFGEVCVYNPNNVRTFAVDVAKISSAETPFGVPPGESMFRIDASAMAPHAQCCGRHTETLCPALLAPPRSVSAANAIGASEVKTIRLSGVSYLDSTQTIMFDRLRI